MDTAQQSSMKIGLNAKGQFSSEIKIYDDNPENLEKRLKEFEEIRDKHAAPSLG